MKSKSHLIAFVAVTLLSSASFGLDSQDDYSHLAEVVSEMRAAREDMIISNHFVSPARSVNEGRAGVRSLRPTTAFSPRWSVSSFYSSSSERLVERLDAIYARDSKEN